MCVFKGFWSVLPYVTKKKAPICPKAITLEGPEEAVALCGWRLHRALEPWEIAEPPPRQTERPEEDGDERPKGRGKGKAKGLADGVGDDSQRIHVWNIYLHWSLK